MLPFVVLGPLFVLYGFSTISGLDYRLPTVFYGHSTLLPDISSAVNILVPGINLSLAGSLLWSISVLIATIFHEFGHYLAAKWYSKLI